MFKKLFTLLSMFAVLLFSHSCFKQDVSDCPPQDALIKVYFNNDFTRGVGGSIDPAEVKRINLFVFDEEGVYRGVWIDSNPKLSQDYHMTIQGLPVGRYTMVVWGGLYDPYCTVPAIFVEGQTKFEEAILQFNYMQEPVVTHHLIYAGPTKVAVKNLDNQVCYMTMEQNTNTINLTIEGLKYDTDQYRFSVYDNNGRYHFDNSFAPCEDFKYSTFCDNDDQERLAATLSILKLAADRQPTIEVFNEALQEILYRANLVELLNARGTDYKKEHIFNVHIKFGEEVGAGVDVIIDGWKVVEDGAILM